MPGMRFRKLRIAWSVTCGIVAVLLISLWARSYPGADVLMRSGIGGQTAFTSSFGGIDYEHVYQSGAGDGSWAFWRIRHDNWNWRFKPRKLTQPCRIESDSKHFTFSVSIWFCVVLAGASSILSCPWRLFRQF